MCVNSPATMSRASVGDVHLRITDTSEVGAVVPPVTFRERPVGTSASHDADLGASALTLHAVPVQCCNGAKRVTQALLSTVPDPYVQSS